MFISESQLGYKQDQYIDLMDVLPVLESDENYYDPAMVPIVENSNYGRGIIKIEDISAFAEANGIYDMGYAISAICESSRVHPADLLFTIKEETLYMDEHLSDIVIEMVQSGVPVATVPISDYDPVAVLGNTALNFFGETGSTYYLDAFANMDWDCLMEVVLDQAVQNRMKEIVNKARSLNQGQSLPTDYDDDLEILKRIYNYSKKPDGKIEYSLKSDWDKSFKDLPSHYTIKMNDLALGNDSGHMTATDDNKKASILFNKGAVIRDNDVMNFVSWNQKDNQYDFDFEKAEKELVSRYGRDKGYEVAKKYKERFNDSTFQKLLNGAKDQHNLRFQLHSFKKRSDAKISGSYDFSANYQSAYNTLTQDEKNLVGEINKQEKYIKDTTFTTDSEEKDALRELQNLYDDYKKIIEISNDIGQPINDRFPNKKASELVKQQGNSQGAKEVEQTENNSVPPEGPKNPEEAKGFIASLKKSVGKGRDAIAKAIAWANNAVRKLRDKLERTPDGKTKGIIRTIIDKILACVDWLTAKMHNIVSHSRADIGDYKYGDKRD